MPIRMKAADVRKLGLVLPAKSRGAKGARTAKASPSLFIAACLEHGLPRPEPEWLFDAKRKWRFDWAWVNEGCGVALEIQGGLFSGGRHVRGAALLKEHEKLNRAACLGWRVLYATPADVKTGRVFALLKEALR